MFITKKTVEHYTGPKGSGKWTVTTYLLWIIPIKKVTLTKFPHESHEK